MTPSEAFQSADYTLPGEPLMSRDTLAGEDTITATQAGKLARSTAHPVHPATVRRWIQRGVIGRSGVRVRLDGYRCGGVWMTSVQALGRFTATRRQQQQRAADEATRLGV